MTTLEVPREPTFEMVERGAMQVIRALLKGVDGGADAWDTTRAVWARMIEAAPQSDPTSTPSSEPVP